MRTDPLEPRAFVAGIQADLAFFAKRPAPQYGARLVGAREFVALQKIHGRVPKLGRALLACYRTGGLIHRRLFALPPGLQIDVRKLTEEVARTAFFAAGPVFADAVSEASQ